MIMLGQKETDENIKKVVTDPNFMIRIKNIQSLGSQVYQKLRVKIGENPEWRTETIAKIAYGLRYIVKFILTLV